MDFDTGQQVVSYLAQMHWGIWLAGGLSMFIVLFPWLPRGSLPWMIRYRYKLDWKDSVIALTRVNDETSYAIFRQLEEQGAGRRCLGYWLNRSAKHGYPPAIYRQALLKDDDPVLQFKLAVRAARLGHEASRFLATKLLEEGAVVLKGASLLESVIRATFQAPEARQPGEMDLQWYEWLTANHFDKLSRQLFAELREQTNPAFHYKLAQGATDEQRGFGYLWVASEGGHREALQQLAGILEAKGEGEEHIQKLFAFFSIMEPEEEGSTGLDREAAFITWLGRGNLPDLSEIWCCILRSTLSASDLVDIAGKLQDDTAVRFYLEAAQRGIILALHKLAKRRDTPLQGADALTLREIIKAHADIIQIPDLPVFAVLSRRRDLMGQPNQLKPAYIFHAILAQKFSTIEAPSAEFHNHAIRTERFLTHFVQLLYPKHAIGQYRAVHYARYLAGASQTKTAKEAFRREVGKFNLTEVLKQAAPEEREALSAVLKLSGVSKTSPVTLEKELRLCGGNSIANVYRGGIGVEYDEIVRDVAKELKVKNRDGKTTLELEELITEAYITDLLENLDEEGKEALLKAIAAQAESQGLDISFSGELGAAATIMAINASGFGAYLFATTAVGAITSAIGVTLPFAFYTTMTSAMSVLSGPVGWIAIAGTLTYKLCSPSMKKMIPAVVLVGGYRQRLMVEPSKIEVSNMGNINLMNSLD